MKRICILLAVILLSCEDPVVGPKGETIIKDLLFVVDTTFIDPSVPRLTAKGSVTNNGSITVAAGWYTEALFYESKLSSTRLGGSKTKIDVSLPKGQSTEWTIYFSSTNIDVRNYPDFDVGDLKGFYP